MKKLPIDVSTFKIMIEENYLYIDKTEYIYNLITQGRYFFLSRPRRFGKSLLISTLQELFSGNKELFKDLWIYKKSDYQWKEHPIVKLDFSGLDISDPKELKESLSSSLDEIAKAYLIDISNSSSPTTKLKTLVKTLAENNRVAVLIDEYDYPLINNLDDLKITKANHKILKNFFSALKSLDAYLHSIFLTGVTKFSKTSIFSGLNNLNDITVDEKAAALLGYTNEEIEKYLPEFIAGVSEKLQSSVQETKAEMKRWYNGYRFSLLPTYVYNPFSILYFLKKQQFSNYWFESGTPSFFIYLLKKEYYSLEKIENLKFSIDALGVFDLEDISLITLLFQTGYLTISDYDSASKMYTLNYPNFGVHEAFQKYILAAITNNTISATQRLSWLLGNALEGNDIPLFCETLQNLLANIPYNLHIPQERYYHSLFQMIGNLLDFNIQSEVLTDKGRLDLVITTKNNIFIFELKFDVDAPMALKQIIDTKYYERFVLSNKEIVLTGLSFSHKKHKLLLSYETKSLTEVLKN